MGWKKLSTAVGCTGAAAVLFYVLKRRAENKTGIQKAKAYELTREEVRCVLQELIQSQAQMDGYMKTVRQEVQSKQLTFEQTYHRIEEVRPGDPLEKYGLSMVEFDQHIVKYSSDSQVKELVAKLTGAPIPDTSTLEKVHDITIKTILDVHQFMLEELESLVGKLEKHFAELPADRRNVYTIQSAATSNGNRSYLSHGNGDSVYLWSPTGSGQQWRIVEGEQGRYTIEAYDWCTVEADAACARGAYLSRNTNSLVDLSAASGLNREWCILNDGGDRCTIQAIQTGNYLRNPNEYARQGCILDVDLWTPSVGSRLKDLWSFICDDHSDSDARKTHWRILDPRSTYDMKTVTLAVQVIVWSKVEQKFGVTPEDIEGTRVVYSQILAANQDFPIINGKIQQIMGKLVGP